MQMTRIATSAVLDTALVIAACVLLLLSYGPSARRLTTTLRGTQVNLHAFGSNDLIEYWSAYRISFRGGNPYHAEAMLAEQRKVDPKRTTPLMMWNPPWLLVMMAPVLHRDFESAARLWLLAGIGLALLSLALARTLAGPGFGGSFGFGLILFSFPPLWQSLGLGQSSVLLLPAVIAFYLLMQGGSPFAAGIALSICTIKPHLFYLIWLYLLWWTARTKKLGLFAGFAAGLLLLVLSAYVCYPHALTAWLELLAPSASIQAEVLPSRWKTATLASALAALAPEGAQPSVQQLLATIVPCAFVLAMLLALRRVRRASSSIKLIPGLLCLSIFTAPFGWFFDEAVLAIAYLEIRTVRGIAGALILNALVTLLAVQVITWHHQLFWYPLIPLAFFLVSRSLQRPLEGKRLKAGP